MRHTIFWLLVFGIATFLFACVDVEDVIDPRFQFVTNSENGSVRESYSYGDSISFEVTFTDNSSIVKSEVAISKVGSAITDTINTWGIYITEDDSLSGSRFVRRTVRKKIPTLFNGNFLETGRYFLYLSVEDVGGSLITFSDTFNITNDQSAPEITIDELGLSRDEDDNYQACAGFVVPIDGYIKDNTQIESLQYRFTREGNSAQFSSSRLFTLNTTIPVENDSLYLANIFGNFGVIVPRSISGVNVQSETLLLTVIATDNFGNKSTSTPIPIVVNCDTEIPTIQVLKTTPTLNQELNFNIPVEGSFSIDEIRFADVSGLNSINIELVGSDPNPIQSETIVLEPDITEIDFTDDPRFTVNSGEGIFDNIGDIFTLIITATDSEDPANVATTRITLNTVEDASPTIEVVDLLINPNDQTIDTTFINVTDGAAFNATNVIERAEAIDVVSYLIASGKIQDDIGIGSIEFTWTRPDESISFTTTLEDTPIVVQLNDLILVNSFTFPIGMNGDYVLKIKITDTKENTTEVSYTIRIN